MRNPSKHEVKLFDPNRDSSVAEMLGDEQKRNPKITSVQAHGRFGLVRTPKGTYALTDEGVGPGRTIDKLGIPVSFWRHFDETLGRPYFEAAPFATATFSLADCEACLTGETMTLDKFIGEFGSRLDRNFESWERVLG